MAKVPVANISGPSNRTNYGVRRPLSMGTEIASASEEYGRAIERFGRSVGGSIQQFYEKREKAERLANVAEAERTLNQALSDQEVHQLKNPNYEEWGEVWQERLESAKEAIYAGKMSGATRKVISEIISDFEQNAAARIRVEATKREIRVQRDKVEDAVMSAAQSGDTETVDVLIAEGVESGLIHEEESAAMRREALAVGEETEVRNLIHANPVEAVEIIEASMGEGGGYEHLSDPKKRSLLSIARREKDVLQAEEEDRLHGLYLEGLLDDEVIMDSLAEGKIDNKTALRIRSLIPEKEPEQPSTQEVADSIELSYTVLENLAAARNVDEATRASLIAHAQEIITDSTAKMGAEVGSFVKSRFRKELERMMQEDDGLDGSRKSARSVVKSYWDAGWFGEVDVDRIEAEAITDDPMALSRSRLMAYYRAEDQLMKWVENRETAPSEYEIADYFVNTIMPEATAAAVSELSSGALSEAASISEVEAILQGLDSND